MQTLQESAVENQAAHLSDNSGEVHPKRKVGVEIVRSADLTSRFFHGPRRGGAFPIFNDNEFWAHRVARAGATG